MTPNINRTLTSKCYIWFILAAAALLIPDRAIAATRMIDDFNSAGWLDNWSFMPGAEFPGARGSLIGDMGFNGGGASLEFDFSCAGVMGACDRRYVAASRGFDAPIPGEVLSLWVRCDACEGSFLITDATGQRLTYSPARLLFRSPRMPSMHGTGS